MSDDLLRAADARPESVRTHWDGCYIDHDLCLIAKLAARVRELEAERVDWARRFMLDGRTPWEWENLCKRAEADYARLRKLMDDAEDVIRRQKSERDALRAENERLKAQVEQLQCKIDAVSQPR